LRSYNDVRQLFNETFCNKNTAIPRSIVERKIRRFNEIGSVKNRSVLGRPKSATNPEKSLDTRILQSFIKNPHDSSRKALQHDIDQKSVLKILKNNKFHPYKVHLVQELNDDNFDRRIEFCELMMERIDKDPNFLSNIVFSDEALSYKWQR